MFNLIIQKYGWMGVWVSGIMYFGWKELQVLLKKKNGSFVSYEKMDGRIKKIEDISLIQIDTNRRIIDNHQELLRSQSELKQDVRDIRNDISDLKTHVLNISKKK